MQRRQKEYVEALEEERSKIQVFSRELPLCLELVTQAIEACRQELASTVDIFPRSESSEFISSEGPMLEFIPIKRSSISEERESSKLKDNKAEKKTDWLRSAQLWSQDPDPKQDEDRQTLVIETKKSGGAIQSSRPTTAAQIAVPSSTFADPVNGGDRREEKEREIERKPRRCWSPELHRRFLHALQQLGGSQSATPKQIRELMKVDGLSNDEVKSHLQKYRLHIKRPSSVIHNNGSPQQPQFVVVGGIWLQAAEYGIVPARTGETNGAVANGIYAPVTERQPLQLASMLFPQLQQNQPEKSPLHSKERGSLPADDNAHCNSPATSSSTHTTTASLPF